MRERFGLLCLAVFFAVWGWAGHIEAGIPGQIVDDSAKPDVYHGVCWEDGSCEDGYCDPAGLCND